MRRTIFGLIFFGLASALVMSLAGPAAAQSRLPSEAPVPQQMPFDVPYGPSLNLATAKGLLTAAEAEARKNGWKMAITVVDAHGDLVAFAKIDDTQLASIEISQKKARTAVRFRRPTAAFYDAMETGHPAVATLAPDLIASPGGLPIIENGKIIGGIGCSGGAGVQDALVCKRAAATIH